MDALRQSRDLYRELHLQQGLPVLSDREAYDIESKILRLIGIAIKEVPALTLFQVPEFFRIFEEALKVHSKGAENVAPVARAYDSLEKYFLLLVEQPWKREFKRLKLYSGYFRTRIKTALPEAEAIFCHAGYSMLPDRQVMVLEKPVQADVVLALAFDGRLYRELCRIISEEYEVEKALSASLDETVAKILNGDRSRSRPESALLCGPADYRANQVLTATGPDMRYTTKDVSSLTRVPSVPKREPIVASQGLGLLPQHGVGFAQGSYAGAVSASSTVFPYGSNGTRFPPTTQALLNEAADPKVFLQSQKVERPPDLHTGTTDALGHLYDTVLDPTRTTQARNGHLNAQQLYLYGLEQQQQQLQQQLHQQQQHLQHQQQLQQLRAGHKANVGPYVTSALPSVVSTQDAFLYPTSNMVGKQRVKNPSDFPFDEGIENDLSPISKTSSDMSPRYNSYKPMSSQGMLASSKVLNSHLPSASSDLGYNTVGPFPSQSHGNMVYTDGTHTSASMGPPPIPARSLKPDLGNMGQTAPTQDKLAFSVEPRSVPHREQTNGGVYTAEGMRSRAAGGRASLKNPKLEVSPSPAVSSSYLGPQLDAMSKVPPSGPTLRRDHHHMALGKSSSLKYSSDSSYGMDPPGQPAAHSSLLQQAQRGRAARSMDLTYAHSRTDGGKPPHPSHDQDVVGVSKKACKACTFENSMDRSHCEICDGKLDEPFTLV